MCFSQMKLAHVTQSAKKANIIISSCKYKQALLCNWQKQASIVKHRLHVWVCAVSPLLPTLLRLTRGRAATASLLRRSPPSVTLSTATCPPCIHRPLDHNNTVAARNREPLSIVYSRSRDGLLLLWRSSIRIKLQHIAICLSLQTPIPFIKY